ncbi:conserved hypothetical protein [Vibrio phage 496E54-1]|nr:conserved hypothetical protein [Vibrio phage 495E54-1]CAH9012376.1 conserved hypothetical protein [Vibrio phage 496E54-1]
MYYIQHNGTKRFLLSTQGVLGDNFNWMDDKSHALSYLTYRAADKDLYFYPISNASVVYVEGNNND